MTLYSSQALGDYICASSPPCQSLHFRRVLDKALREAYSSIYHVDFLNPDGHELNLQDTAFVRDRPAFARVPVRRPLSSSLVRWTERRCLEVLEVGESASLRVAMGRQ